MDELVKTLRRLADRARLEALAEGSKDSVLWPKLSAHYRADAARYTFTKDEIDRVTIWLRGLP